MRIESRRVRGTRSYWINGLQLAVLSTMASQSVVAVRSAIWKSSIVFGSLVLLTCGALIGCQGFSITGGPGRVATPSLVSHADNPHDLVGINSILVAPVQFGAGARQSASGEIVLTQKLEQALGRELSLRLVSARDVVPRLRNQGQEALFRPASVKEIFEAAKSRELDGVLQITVHEYVERAGSALGSSEPARVYFTASLVRLSDSAAVWTGSYRFRDQALSDNLFQAGDRFFQAEQGVEQRPGLGFKSADELLLSGFHKLAEELAAARTARFMAG